MFEIKIECGEDLQFKERISDYVSAALRSAGYRPVLHLTPENDTLITIGV